MHGYHTQSHDLMHVRAKPVIAACYRALQIGESGDPYIQGQRYYQCYVADPKLAAQVRHTVLPALMLELAGPHLRVSALASPRDVTVVCEPLTPYLHLFSMERCDPGGWMARIFSARYF